MGDGEQQEAGVEAVMCAAHYRLDNLCAVIDYNRKQIDGDVEDIMGIAPLADKYRAFNWNVIEVDGHDHEAVIAASPRARAHKAGRACFWPIPSWGRGSATWPTTTAGTASRRRRTRASALVELGTTYDAWKARLLGS